MLDKSQHYAILIRMPLCGSNDSLKLHVLQVTRTFHQEHMPFSAQCYGFAGGGWRDTSASDNTLRAPVKSEEIGADWGDVFQRLQVVPLQYCVPQVS